MVEWRALPLVVLRSPGFGRKPVAGLANRLDLTTERAQFLTKGFDMDINRPLQNYGVRHDQGNELRTAEHFSWLTAQHIQKPGLGRGQTNIRFHFQSHSAYRMV